MMDKIKELVKDQLRTDLPDFKVGDRIRIHVRVIEGDKERLQPFEGDVIGMRGSAMDKTFTVRKISSGVGVERIFNYNSPKIAKIDVVKEGRVRRAKLFYLRKLSGKAARIKDKNIQ
ncbi:MAG: 50S ribosomal protein L19 [Melioribacteraceae bacterium]|nr:50S ribosomal protein L19 [Melioribacteraceae bacterium]